MKSGFPSAGEYAAQEAIYPDLTVVDIHAYQSRVTERYRNVVLSAVNKDCMRLAVFEGEYRWHHHPNSDELFVVVEGRLQIDFAGRDSVELTPWQYIVVPAATIHRTRAIGRTVNLTFEGQGAKTVFEDEEGQAPAARAPSE